MSEMNPISRFFVNASAARRSARYYEWIRKVGAIPNDAACLEIGCGSGRLATRILEGLHPRRYVGTDLDPRQIEEAQRTMERWYPKGLPPPLELRPADMLRLPFPDAQFDVVLAFVALHHASPSHGDFTRIPTALGEIDRVLRPGGALVYSEFIHKEAIRAWLTTRGYAMTGVVRRWRLESAVARKPSPPVPGGGSPGASPGKGAGPA